MSVITPLSHAPFIPQFSDAASPQTPAASSESDLPTTKAFVNTQTPLLNNAQNKTSLLRQSLRGPQQEERTLAQQLMTSSLNSLAEAEVPLSAAQNQTLDSTLNSTLLKAGLQAPAGTTMSDKELWEKTAAAIGQIGDNYLGVYENVMGKYNDFYKSFTDITSQMGNWILPGSDSNNLKLNVKALKSALSDFNARYLYPKKEGVIYPPQNSATGLKTTTESDAKQWASELNIPSAKVVKVNNDNYVVMIDNTSIETMIRDLTALGSVNAAGILTLDNAKFQAWQSGFKSQEENLKNTLQTSAQKYSNANSLYDNLVKVLSSTITSCLETAKTFLHG